MNKKLRFLIFFIVLSFEYLPFCSKHALSQDHITIKGSDTMVHLVTAIAEEAMNKFPNLDIAVTGGGSGTGISALINKGTSIAASSRELQEKEKEEAKKNHITPVVTPIALDGIAIVSHPTNPISEISIENLKRVFTGEIKSWSSIGGLNLPILLLSRESNSGTYVFFQEHILSKQDFAIQARLLPSTSSIMSATQSDKGAIGYVGFGYVTKPDAKVKILAIKKTDSAQPLLPSMETIKNGSYPISRSLYLITPGQPSGNTKIFIDFCLSKDGQRLVSENGYIPIE